MSRFTPGLSGNPSGRPRKSAATQASAFDVIMDKTFLVNQGGRQRELNVEEALQLKIYQEALAGNRPARRAVLKMIAKREQWKAARKPRRPSFSFVASVDPTNANAALLLLGIACRDPYDYGTRDDYDRYKLETWAVEAALSRKRRPPLTSKALNDIRHCVLEPNAIAWPEPVEE